jgi:hypothetical protein
MHGSLTPYPCGPIFAKRPAPVYFVAPILAFLQFWRNHCRSLIQLTNKWLLKARISMTDNSKKIGPAGIFPTGLLGHGKKAAESRDFGDQ